MRLFCDHARRAQVGVGREHRSDASIGLIVASIRIDIRAASTSMRLGRGDMHTQPVRYPRAVGSNQQAYEDEEPRYEQGRGSSGTLFRGSCG